MQRGSAIAVVAAAAGILVAGSAASVAVINAAGSGTTSIEEPIVAASVTSQEQPAVLPDPTVSDAPLPQVIVPAPVDIPDPGVEPVAAATSEPTPDASKETAAKASSSTDAPASETAKATAKESPTATPEPTVQLISARQARQVATAATPGTVVATSLVTHAGYEAYAVQIERPDGSVVTGFVEATTGVAYDWVVNKAAPQPQPTATYDDDHDDDDHDDDDHDDDDHDDDHEDDDDD